MILLFGNAFGAQATAYQLTGGFINIVPILIGSQLTGDVLHNVGLGYALAMGMVVHPGHHAPGLHVPPAALRAVAPMTAAGGTNRTRRRASRRIQGAGEGRGAEGAQVALALRVVAHLLGRRPVLLPAAARGRSPSRCGRSPLVLGLRGRPAGPALLPRASATRSWSASSRSSCSIALLVPTAYWVRLRMPRARPSSSSSRCCRSSSRRSCSCSGSSAPTATRRCRSRTRTSAAPPSSCAAYVILSFPYMYRAVDTGLRAMDVRSLTEAAQSLGAGWLTDPHVR